MMEPRIDMNLSISEEPDSWVHSACFSSVRMAWAGDGSGYGAPGRTVHPIRFRPGQTIGESTYLVRTRSGEHATSDEIGPWTNPTQRLRVGGTVRWLLDRRAELTWESMSHSRHAHLAGR